MDRDYIDKHYKGKCVLIKSTDKIAYIRDNVIGKHGIIERANGDSVGVSIEGKVNKASAYGIYWFDKSQVKIIKDESEDIKMEGFKNIAIVNLLEDYNKKDYAFALYDEELDCFCKEHVRIDGALVVVNANGKNNRLLGTLKNIVSVEEYYSIDANKNRKITAEVVGVVNMNGYIARENEKVRLEELAKKKAAIERELEAEINKRKSIEYYEAMAKEYSDNPKLAELVAELQGLGA